MNLELLLLSIFLLICMTAIMHGALVVAIQSFLSIFECKNESEHCRYMSEFGPAKYQSVYCRLSMGFHKLTIMNIILTVMGLVLFVLAAWIFYAFLGQLLTLFF